MYQGYIAYRKNHEYKAGDMIRCAESSKQHYDLFKQILSQNTPTIQMHSKRVDRIEYIQRMLTSNPYIMNCLDAPSIQSLWNQIMNKNLDESILARSIDILVKCKAYDMQADRYPDDKIVNNIPWERVRLYVASDMNRPANLIKVYYNFLSIYSTDTDTEKIFKHGRDYHYRDYLLVMEKDINNIDKKIYMEDGTLDDTVDDEDLAGDFVTEIRCVISKDLEMSKYVKETILPDLFGKTTVEQVCETAKLSKKIFIKEHKESVKENGRNDTKIHKTIHPRVKGIVIGPNGTGKSTMINEFFGYHLNPKMQESLNKYGYVFPNDGKVIIKRKLTEDEKKFFKENGVTDDLLDCDVSIEVTLTDTGGYMESYNNDSSTVIDNPNGEKEKVNNTDLFAFIVNRLAMANSQYDPYSFILYCVCHDSKFNNPSCMANILRIKNTFPDVPIIFMMTQSDNDSYDKNSATRVAINEFLNEKITFNNRHINTDSVTENNVLVGMKSLIYRAASINARSLMAGATIKRQHGLNRLGKIIVNAFEDFHNRYGFPEYDQVKIKNKWVSKIFSIAYEGIITNNYFSIIVYGFTAMARELISDYHNKTDHNPAVAKIYSHLEGIILSAGYGCNMTLVDLMCTHMGINGRGIYITNSQMSKVVNKLKEENSDFRIRMDKLLERTGIKQFTKDKGERARLRDLHINEMTNGFALAFIAEYLGNCIINATTKMEAFVDENPSGMDLAYQMDDVSDRKNYDRACNELTRVFKEKMADSANEFINQRLNGQDKNDPVPFEIQKSLLESNQSIDYVFKAYRMLIAN